MGKTGIVIFSGGLDSTVLLWRIATEHGPEDLGAISFNYGQRHAIELLHAHNIAKMLGVEHKVIDMCGLKQVLGGSSQTDPTIPVPEGHYEEESMRCTVVPNRNMIMISIAAAWAISEGAQFLAYGAHAGDHAIYPDCRPEFVAQLREAIFLADWRHVQLEAPFLKMTKADIVRMGMEVGAPLGETYSCYKGECGVHCGKCGTCRERIEAFQLAGVLDPTHYEA